MSESPHAAWGWLARELAAWEANGERATFWWRDDDACAASDELTHLLALVETAGVPVALATIPARLEPGLVAGVKSLPGVSLLQHGYAHVNHAASGALKRELGGDAARADLLARLAQGRERLAQAFGAGFLPVMVPPWNRIDEDVVDALPGLGFRGLSTMRVRKRAYPAAQLYQVNTHLDPVHWRHDGGFIGTWSAIAILVQHLQARRSGYRDRDEPTGLLTHHLVQNEATWRFTADLLDFVRDHPGACWLHAAEIWPAGEG
ncbi:MAG: polysaccharide deacetylase family protein [Gammaproteobacteria bacterium]|nr:polysaccharide deacetylase family protein [Gammaproteobacteria bacterium]